MTDRAILFSAPMVRALLDGRKTQTRRVLKGVPPLPCPDNLVHTPKHDAPYFDSYCGGKKSASNPRGMTENWCWWTRDDRRGQGCKVPFVPGDRLWVKEAWGLLAEHDPLSAGDMERSGIDIADGEVRYNATCHPGAMPKGDGIFGRYRHARYMPRWASRLTLTVTDVRVQRLQDISDDDALAEGPNVKGWADFGHLRALNGVMVETDHPHVTQTPRFWFRELWNSINGPDAWAANPWVVAVTFTVAQRNIDAVPHD